MTDCQTLIRKVFEYLDHELTDAEKNEFRRHMDLCRQCFDQVEFERRLREECRTKTCHPCPDALKKRIQDLIRNF